MKKIIKKYGNSNVILLDAEDMKIYDMKEGNVVELHIRKTNIQENSESTGSKLQEPDDVEFSLLSKKTDENISEICKEKLHSIKSKEDNKYENN